MNKIELYSAINLILAEWDPIGVGSDIAGVEYEGYVSEISTVLANGSIEEINKCLKKILYEDLGFSEPIDARELNKEIELVALKIYSLLNNKM